MTCICVFVNRKADHLLIEKAAILGTALNQFHIPIVLCCFYRAKKVFHHPTFVTNVEQKIARRSSSDDVPGLTRTGSSLDWSAACERVLDYYVFLDDLDVRDWLFLDLAKDLLRKPYPEATVELIKDLQHPLPASSRPLTPVIPTHPIFVIPVDLTRVIPIAANYLRHSDRSEAKWRNLAWARKAISRPATAPRNDELRSSHRSTQSLSTSVSDDADSPPPT